MTADERAAANAAVAECEAERHKGDGRGRRRRERRPEIDPIDGVWLTDLGNADRLATRFGDDLLYCDPRGEWLRFDGKRYVADRERVIWGLAEATARSIFIEAAEEPDKDRQAAIVSHAIKSQSQAKLRDMIVLARHKKPVLPERFDADPWLFNCRNGTLDLRTGELRKHRRADMLTKLSIVTYDPRATCPRWELFIEEVSGSDVSLQLFLQRLAGYCLTGDTREQKLFFAHGPGANGKSTFFDAIRHVAGDYGRTMAPDLLMLKNLGEHPTGIADLVGARLVTTVETDEGRRFAESFVKQLVGGDTLKARRMREDFFEFRPTCKILLAANHRPVIRGTDWAIWRRICLVPFTVCIPEDRRDKGLGDKLRAEASGILNWMMAGCLEWQQEGLAEPAAVTGATSEYRTESDDLGAFITDCCMEGVMFQVRTDALRQAYEQWCARSGEHPIPAKAMTNRLRERGYTPGKVARARGWLGIGLRETNP